MMAMPGTPSAKTLMPCVFDEGVIAEHPVRATSPPPIAPSKTGFTAFQS